jgi:hypothetical protein
MEIALIHNNSLELGPFGMNVRYINQELEELEVEERISPQSFSSLPIHFSDGLTHLVEVEKSILQNDPKYHNVGNFTWEIIEENGVPVKVLLTHPITDKTLEEVKEFRKQEVAPYRREKENTIITIKVQEAFDWELVKLQEIDACETIDAVYDVVVREQPEEIERPELSVEE